MTELEKSLQSLSPIQQTAVTWQDGASLILAGPGAGKTRVLTTRIARILNDTKDRNFRILALTFTTKAAMEMRDRVELMAPGLAEERTFIGTFHAFCTLILRQHGSHIGIKPDFGIFGQKEDQEAILMDALKNAIKDGRDFSESDISMLVAIKELKKRLITPGKAKLKGKNQHLIEVYELYEETLKNENALDFEGLILETCGLLSKVPAVAARIRQSYPYWMIDEFQDTTPAQYWLLYYLSNGEFKNLFAVADDDQIIYQWAGASYRQIEKFRQDYKPELIQLVENHRCPPEIVAMANNLVANNSLRSPEKKPTVPSRKTPLNAVSYEIFDTDLNEREAISNEILVLGKEHWGEIVILGRTRSLLEPFAECLRSKGVNATLAQRRDSFISPHFIWLQAVLDQCLHPNNKRLFNLLVDSANRICNLELEAELLLSEAESLGQIPYEYWSKVIQKTESSIAKQLGSLTEELAQSRTKWKKVIQDGIPILLNASHVGDEGISDTSEDYAAWQVSIKEIRGEIGHAPELSDLVQGIALRSKEPPLEPDTVKLMTIHTSKGLEFKNVYVIGLAEGEMPSWQSCKEGNNSREMEEERRNCFVAITRTQEKLKLTVAKSYRNWSKEPSRFLREMSII